jgi:hypothetical protein
LYNSALGMMDSQEFPDSVALALADSKPPDTLEEVLKSRTYEWLTRLAEVLNRYYRTGTGFQGK